MSNWSIFDWVGYGSLLASALILAIIQGVKDMTAPSWMPALLSSYFWNYIPLFLIIISACIFLFKAKGWGGNRQGNINQGKFTKNFKFTEIKNKKFFNETVVVDGHSYEFCEFTNTSFQWNGTAPFQLKHDNFYGSYQIKTDSDAIFGTITLLKAFNMLKDNIPIVHGDNRTPLNLDVKHEI